MIGLVPAAGRADRLGGLPKMLLPVNHEKNYLLAVTVHRLRLAGCTQVVVAASPDNQNIISRYLPPDCIMVTVSTQTMSETLLTMRHFSGDQHVICAMPDTFWGGDHTVRYMDLTPEHPILAHCWKSRESQKTKMGMVNLVRGFDSKIRTSPTLLISAIQDKPQFTTYQHHWGVLQWLPDFWKHISPDDSHLGYALQRAMASGMQVRAVEALNTDYFDCGTLGEYTALLKYQESATAGSIFKAKGG